MSDQREERLVYELSNCIARHADWLSGRDFQRIAERVARGCFEESDLNEYMTADDMRIFFEALADALSDAPKRA